MPIVEMDRDTEIMMNHSTWWGVPTLFRSDYMDDVDGLKNVDIGLVGVPHSSGNGTTERNQHLGPRALRDISPEYRRNHGVYGFFPWDKCTINDLGDVPLPNAMVNDEAMKDMKVYFDKLAAEGVRPVSIGGDHSITLPILRALAGENSKLADGPIALVHFDAHFDTYGSKDYGDRPFYDNIEWAGAWGRIAHQEGLIDGDSVVQIGMRGHPVGKNEGYYGRENGYRIIEKSEYDKIGIEETIAIIRQRVGNRPVYLTFDLDVLDTTVAPGVSNLEVGYEGMGMEECMKIIQGMRGLNVIGADVACLMPTKDNPNKITSMNASVIMFEQLSLITEYLASNNATKKEIS